MWDRDFRVSTPFHKVLIPYSSGMGVGQAWPAEGHRLCRLNTLFVRYGCGTQTQCTTLSFSGCLNTLFVRYGCGTNWRLCPARTESLNTLFVRYGCGTNVPREYAEINLVLIPYSSGMGVGHQPPGKADAPGGLNTLFVRYGCGTEPRSLCHSGEVS